MQSHACSAESFFSQLMILHHSESEDQQNTHTATQLHSEKFTHFNNLNLLLIFYAAVTIGDGYINNQIVQ
jgi:hypothetical protein